jgi:hypothetical protein
MSLSDLASLGSFVSGVAVVFSFVFLGLQIRQSDRNQRAVLNAQSSSLFAEHLLKLSEPHLANLFWRMMEGETNFTGAEALQLMGIVTALLGDYADIDERRLSGLADADEATKQGVSNLLGYKFARVLWSIGETTFSPSFRSQVNAIIRDTPVQPPGSFMSMVKDTVARMEQQATTLG